MNDVDRVIQGSLDLLWSQWSDLGVPGAGRGMHPVVVSPVDLLLYTPGILGDRDARLAMLVQRWCAQHGVHAFGSRELAVRRAALPEPARDAFDAWMSILHRSAEGPWPVPETPPRVEGPPIGTRDVPFRPDRRTAVHLRARSMFGIGVRADLVCALLHAHADARVLRSPDVAHLGHSSRAVQLTLAAFESAGLVHVQKTGRTHTHALTRPRDLASVLDTDGLRWFAWHQALPIVFHLVGLAAHPSANRSVQHVRAHTIARLLGPYVHAIPELPGIPVRPGDDNATERLMAWGAAAVATFAGQSG